MPLIPDYTDAGWHRSRTDLQLRISILEGKGRQMPTWWGRVSDQQATDLVAYVRSFGPAPKPAAVEAGTSPDSGDLFSQLRRQREELERQMYEVPPAPVNVAGIPRPGSPGPPAPATPGPGTPTPGTVTSGAARFFGQNCAGCHTIGGGALTGPDLKNVTQRRERDWLVKLLLDPKSILHSGDPYVLQLLAKARGVEMPNIFGMTRERAEAMLDFLEAQSQMEKSWFAELPISGRPLTEADAEHGRELFSGAKALANGGPSCISCHTASGSGGPEGGRLGPDLTRVYERVGGRTALTARLWDPVTPTMLPVYQQHALQEEEVLSLVAYLEKAAREGVDHDAGPPLHFLLMGLGGTVVGLVAANALFGRRTSVGEG